MKNFFDRCKGKLSLGIPFNSNFRCHEMHPTRTETTERLTSSLEVFHPKIFQFHQSNKLTRNFVMIVNFSNFGWKSRRGKLIVIVKTKRKHSGRSHFTRNISDARWWDINESITLRVCGKNSCCVVQGQNHFSLCSRSFRCPRRDSQKIRLHKRSLRADRFNKPKLIRFADSFHSKSILLHHLRFRNNADQRKKKTESEWWKSKRSA